MNNLNNLTDKKPNMDINPDKSSLNKLESLKKIHKK